jgi:hypothetical protein
LVHRRQRLGLHQRTLSHDWKKIHTQRIARPLWSAPMRTVAADLGLSDVGPKKAAEKAGIPTPPQGHWNRVAAGKTVDPKPVIPPRGGSAHQRTSGSGSTDCSATTNRPVRMILCHLGDVWIPSAPVGNLAHCCRVSSYRGAAGHLYLLAPHVTLRITMGPAGNNAQCAISTFISVLHPRIRFVTVPVPDLEASSKALEDGKVDIAVVRSDIKPAGQWSNPRYIKAGRHRNRSSCEFAD